MNVKHAPGPWKRGFAATSDFDGEKNGRPIRKKHIVWEEIVSADGKKIASTSIYVQGHDRTPVRISENERLANANLILSAPDLLAACEAVLNLCDEHGNLPDNGEFSGAAIAEAVRDAVQVARGKKAGT